MMATHGNKRKDETPGTPDQEIKRVKHAQAEHESDLSEVEKQKEKAKEVFAELIDQADSSLLSDESKKNISSQLEDGKVHPILHALLWIKNKLHQEKLQGEFKGMELAPNAGDSIVGGHASEEYELELKNEAQNWKEAIREDEMGATIIHDYQMEWCWDGEATKFAVELLNSSATMLGHGVEMTKLPNTSFIDYNIQYPSLLTRPQTRGIVADCFQRIERYHARQTGNIVAAITGSPGIGARAGPCFMHYNKPFCTRIHVFLYSFRRSKWLFLFMRRKGKSVCVVHKHWMSCKLHII